jgi:hypothetical protein
MTEHMPDEPPAANLTGWLLELRQRRHPLARQLHESADPYAVARKLHLPIPSYRLFNSPAAFVADPAAGLRPLWQRGIRTFYVGLRPVVEGYPKFRNEAPLAAAEVAKYVTDSIPPEHNHAYSLRVAEYVVAVCGMVIVCNPSGTVHVDMVMGDLGPLATGRQKPQYQARSDRFTGALRYRQVDADSAVAQHNWAQDRAAQLPEDHPVMTPHLRAAIGAAVGSLPAFPGEVRGAREPGRYEAAIVEHEPCLAPVFVDAQPDYLEGRHHTYALPEITLY